MVIEEVECQRGGLDVSVCPGSEPGWLRLVPSRRAPLDILKTRETGLSLLRSYASSIEGFKVPRSRWLGQSFEVEKAEGVCLDGVATNDEDIVDFYAIPTEQKLKALLIYLKAVQKVNQKKELIHDHNPDGIFLEFNSGKIDVWLVDPGDIAKGRHREEIGYERAEVLEVFDGHYSGIHKLLSRFFDRDKEEDCIPASLRAFQKKVEADSQVSVDDLVQAVELVMPQEVEKAEQWRERVHGVILRQKKLVDLKAPRREQIGEKEKYSYDAWVGRRNRDISLFFQNVLDGNQEKAARLLRDLVNDSHLFIQAIGGFPREEVQFWRDFSMVAESAVYHKGFGFESDYPSLESPKNIAVFYQSLGEIVNNLDRRSWLNAIHSLALTDRIVS